MTRLLSRLRSRLQLRWDRLHLGVYRRLWWLLSPEREVNSLRLLLVALGLIVLLQAILLILGNPGPFYFLRP